MGISDKDRKLLWGRSGNRCAICRTLLAIEAKGDDPASLIGQEAHIYPSNSGGSRASESPPNDIDGYSNRILLCANHHKITIC